MTASELVLSVVALFVTGAGLIAACLALRAVAIRQAALIDRLADKAATRGDEQVARIGWENQTLGARPPMTAQHHGAAPPAGRGEEYDITAHLG